MLEDLDYAGFPRRANQLTPSQCHPCLQWLAQFHAQFLNTKPDSLWSVGTYWHLATRGQEWHACVDPELKAHAHSLDIMLNNCRHQTLVHGDAKVANFCFSEEQSEPGVAAVDFQYIGGGCGIRDVAYFLGSCLTDHDCQLSANDLLDYYFAALELACRYRDDPITDGDFRKIEREWRTLYPIACADFHRFLAGWSPNHSKINDYIHQQKRIALETINNHRLSGEIQRATKQ